VSDRGVLTIAGVLAVGMAVLFATAELAVVISGHGWRHYSMVQVLAAFSHSASPGRALGVAGLSATLYMSVFAALVLLVSALLLLLRRLFGGQHRRKDDPLRADGLAPRCVIARGAGPKALVQRGATLRPSLAKPEPRDLGIRLGSSSGVDCYASVEDSVVILGPPRSGKGMNLVVAMILDAPGPVITTSTRSDSLATTLHARAAKGPVGVFDPEGLARGVAGGLRWSPVRGCEDPATATNRANALCAKAAGGVSDASFWQDAAAWSMSRVTRWAALAGHGAREVYRWACDPRAAREAVAILKGHDSAVESWAEDLDAIVTGDERMRSSVWAMVANVFAALAVPEVCEQFTPSFGNELHPEAFLANNGTLFLLGTASGAVTTARFIAALIEDVVRAARLQASSRVGARLDPPLSLILDEAANFPLPSLTGLMSEGGGTGMMTTVVLQSLAQARDRWGKDQADAIWETANVKIVLGGGAGAQDLRDLAQLIGEYEVQEVSESSSSGGPKSRTETTRQRAIFDASRLRAIPLGYGVMLLRTTSPFILTLTPWTKRKDAPALREQRRQVEEELRAEAQRRLESRSVVGQ
jgi:type IV secretion system protein VirD4